jgi:putative transposase
MNRVFLLFLHLFSALAKLIQPGGYRAVIAENLLLKQQLLINSRARKQTIKSNHSRSLGLGILFAFPEPETEDKGNKPHFPKNGHVSSLLKIIQI